MTIKKTTETKVLYDGVALEELSKEKLIELVKQLEDEKNKEKTFKELFPVLNIPHDYYCNCMECVSNRGVMYLNTKVT